MAKWKRGWNPMARHTNIVSQPDSYINSQPASQHCFGPKRGPVWRQKMNERETMISVNGY